MTLAAEEDTWADTDPDDVTLDPKSEKTREGWVYPYTAFPKQQLASSYLVDEILFGGAASGGKSDWMLAELVTLCLAVPNSKSLLLRNTYGELQEEIIPRLEARIPGWVGKYSNKLRAFVFYNGSRLRLGYLEREQDQRHYIGAEYVCVGFDELTLLPWASYRFLASRVRASGEIARRLKAIGRRPCRLATSNPGGPYHTQVKEHFVDPAPPGEIVVDPETGMSRVYVPATVDDNPAMGTEYRHVLESLPPEKRKALLYGSWDILEGVRFSQWRRDRHVIRPDEFPLPLLSGERVVGIDYGFAAPFAAVWMVKLGNGLIIVYREAYRTELTAVQQAQLIRDLTTDEEWQAGLSIVVDPSMFGRRDASAPKTGNPHAPPVSSPAHDYQTVLGRTPIRANNDRLSGWARLDEKLRVQNDGWPRFLVYDTCVDLIRTLPALLRSKVNPDDVSQSPKQEDHLCHPAGTLVQTDRGAVPIESIRPGDLAWTRRGPREITAWARTSTEATVGGVRLSNGQVIRCTADHPYWVKDKGWVSADTLRYGDILEAWKPTKTLPPVALSLSSTTASSIAAIPTPSAAQIRSTTSHQPETAVGATGDCTRTSTVTITGPFPSGTMSTTQTTTPSITRRATLSPSPERLTSPITCHSQTVLNSHGRTSSAPSQRPLSGTAPRKAEHGTLSTPATYGNVVNRPLTSVTSVGTTTPPRTKELTDSVPTNARPLTAARPASTTKPAPASGAVIPSPSTSTPSPVDAPVHVVADWHIETTEPVYSLTVNEHHEFYADGILASNCDSLRYGLQNLEPRNPMATGTDNRRKNAAPLTAGLRNREW